MHNQGFSGHKNCIRIGLHVRAYGLFTWSVTKNSRNIRKKFAKNLRNIREKFVKNSQKIREKLTFVNFSGFFHEFFANISQILIFCEYFANISRIFREYFANFSQIFCVRPREESIIIAHVFWISKRIQIIKWVFCNYFWQLRVEKRLIRYP